MKKEKITGLRPVMIKMSLQNFSGRDEWIYSLFGSLDSDAVIDWQDLFDRLDGDQGGSGRGDTSFRMTVEGQLFLRGGSLVIAYDESELTGMEGARTELSFRPENPGTVTLLRYGTVRTALVLEAGKRNICAYETQYMPFEICTLARRVDNSVSTCGGHMTLDYIVEIRGAKAERNIIDIDVLEASGDISENEAEANIQKKSAD